MINDFDAVKKLSLPSLEETERYLIAVYKLVKDNKKYSHILKQALQESGL